MARFTQEEKKTLIEVVNSGKSFRKQAPELAKRLNRSQLSVLNKLYYLRKKLGLAPDRKKRTYIRKPVQPQQQQKQSFTLNFNPSKTEVHVDHVRLYF
jgi:hypothetical protein